MAQAEYCFAAVALEPIHSQVMSCPQTLSGPQGLSGPQAQVAVLEQAVSLVVSLALVQWLEPSLTTAPLVPAPWRVRVESCQRKRPLS